ncbi:hypothetical protein PVAND_012276 [Polypedilum vanderplanki]|uniref:Ig-like domain-containing protein n=1 Tax=Polypedilum vanderplanki TaxID=319348 RepID=A0A9J6CLX9_POLVA|nr:hypothetical protein PVAND_012276 [Polypedilum vanderplanki]
MSETVTLIIMLTLCAIFYTKISAIADDNGFELTKFIKRPNENLELHCSLNNKHEKFNKNITVSWYFMKLCNLCTLSIHEFEKEEWELIDCNGSCSIILEINNTQPSGFYMCKMFPYHIDNFTVLQIEIVRTFEVEVTGLPNSPPEILYDTPNNVQVVKNSTVVLQCKCHSVKQVPKIQWFKKIIHNENEIDNEPVFFDSIREINFLESSYRPMPSSVKKIDEDIYLSKLIISNLTEDSIYTCVVVNYFGYKYRNFLISIQQITTQNEDEEDEERESIEINFTQSDKSLELFFIPLFLLIKGKK